MALFEAPFIYAARWFLPDADRRDYEARDSDALAVPA
jgi:hypothetical protein